MTEKEFQAKIVQLAKTAGWLVYHTYNSRRSEPGFPDLVMVRGQRVLFWEVKTDVGKASDEQIAWLATLLRAGQEARIVRPSNWDEIVKTLASR